MPFSIAIYLIATTILMSDLCSGNTIRRKRTSDSLIPVVRDDFSAALYRSEKGRKLISYCYSPEDATNVVVDYLHDCKSIFPEQASDLSKPYLRATYVRKDVWKGDDCVTRKDIARETNDILKDWFCDTIPPFRMVMPKSRRFVEGFPKEEEEMERLEDNEDFDKANKEIMDEIDRIALEGAKRRKRFVPTPVGSQSSSLCNYFNPFC